MDEKLRFLQNKIIKIRLENLFMWRYNLNFIICYDFKFYQQKIFYKTEICYCFCIFYIKWGPRFAFHLQKSLKKA